MSLLVRPSKDPVNLLIVGPAGVGKTVLTVAFYHCQAGGLSENDTNELLRQARPTPGLNTVVFDQPLPDGSSCRVAVLEGGGNFISVRMARAHLKRMDVMAVVYDVSSRQSFADMTVWLRNIQTDLRKWRPFGDDAATAAAAAAATAFPAMPQLFLLANKATVGTDNNYPGTRAVSREEGQHLAQQFGVAYFEVDARPRGVEQTRAALLAMTECALHQRATRPRPPARFSWKIAFYSALNCVYRLWLCCCWE